MKKNLLSLPLVAAISVACFLAVPAVNAYSGQPATWDSASLPVLDTENTAPVSPQFDDSRDTEIDQNQPSNTTYMASFSQGDLAQSFQQTHGNICGAGINLQAGIGSSDNVTIAIWDALPNAGGTMLAEASATGTQGEWVDVFWETALITPATTYYLVFTGNTTLGITGDTGNPYPHGHVYANPGYQPFTDFDYTFRTYYDPTVSLVRHTWASVKTLF